MPPRPVPDPAPGPGPGLGSGPDGADAGPDRRPDVAGAAPRRRARSGPGAKGGRQLTLKSRAVGYLSRREHSRLELARKLSLHCEDAAELDSLLDDLEREGWLSDARYAQSLAHRRAGKQGAARILQELRQQGVDDEHVADLREDLRRTEAGRARAVWAKRFGGQLPATPAERARQQRFLAGRGFTHEAIRAALGGRGDDESGADPGDP